MFLTRKQKEIFDFVRDYIHSWGYAPSIDEIRRAFKLSSVATVHKHLRLLEQKGMIRRTPNQNRGLEIVDDGNGLPLLGTIAAGEPIEIVRIDETADIPAELFGKGGAGVFKVRGNSMIGEQICDGDYVIVERKETAENGQMVVALINQNKTTLKKYYRQEDGRIRLEPANPAMESTIVAEKDVQIEGRIIGILRKY